MTTTYILSGGGALGAFQAGALAAIQDGIDAGTLAAPEHIVGISVGALNATLAALNHHDMRWVANFWHQHIRKPSDIADSKGLFTRVIPGLIRGRFDGLVDPAPLETMMKKRLYDYHALRKSPIIPHVGACRLSDGALVYATPRDVRFLRMLMASASIPVIFPPVIIDGEAWVDGGLVEVAPATHAIKLGADRIVCILCQPKDRVNAPLDASNPWALAERIMDIATTTILEANVRAIEGVNGRLRYAERSIKSYSAGSFSPRRQIMEERGLEGKRIIDVHFIRPPSPLGYNTGAFTEGDIARALAMGREEGAAFVGGLKARRAA